MFRISYHILKNLQVDNTKVADDYVRYYWFIGDVKLETQSECIDMSWGWVPIVDFAIFIKLINKSLLKQENRQEVFDFTESSEYLEFKRTTDRVEIRTSFSEDNIITNFNEFSNEVDRFYNSVIDEVFHANPFLRHNREFLRIIAID